MKKLFLFVVLFGITVFSNADAQDQGVNNYLNWEGMVDTVLANDISNWPPEGTERLQWLPEGKGWIEAHAEEESNGFKFYRVDPSSLKKRDLFSKNERQSLLTQYRGISGVESAGMPFESFEYIDNFGAIRFEIEDQKYTFRFSDNKLLKHHKIDVKAQPNSDGLMRRMEDSQLWNGSYSPDYTKIAYVKGYDLFLFDTITGKESQLSTGGYEHLMNGRPDWVYPEELGQRDAYWWSPDGKKIAYLQFDEREVYMFPIIHELTEERKPAFETILEMQRYPTAGEDNPVVKLFIVDVETFETTEVETNSTPQNYITRISWQNSALQFQRMNRWQNKLEILQANPISGKAHTVLVEEDEAFIRLTDHLTYIDGGKYFIWSSERTGWRHLYMYDREGSLVRQITDGEWEIAAISAIDEKKRTIYFTAQTNTGLEQHLFSVKFDGSKFKQLTKEPGVHTISMDPAGKYFVDTFTSQDVPRAITVYKSDGKKIRDLSHQTASVVEERGINKPEFVSFKAADEVTDLHGYVYKPVNFDPAKKYPLVIGTYGGPSPGVRNSYYTTNGFNQLAQLGFIVFKLDNRGTLNRGKKYLAETYMKFGQVDVDDQAAGVKFLTQRPYVDGSRVGMFGHSYGGYMTAMSLLRYPDIYHVGVSGSPVSDWRTYDSIYTERYMRRPQDNLEGYDIGSTLNYVDNLKGKLLITHGSIDNNVHPNNTIHLVDALQKAGKPFDMMYFPEHRHGIRGYNGTHYTKTRVSYFLKHLKPAGWEKSLEALWSESY